MALPKQQHQFVLSVAEASELEKPPQAEGDGFKGCSTYHDHCSGLISVSRHCFSEIYPSNHQRGRKKKLPSPFYVITRTKKPLWRKLLELSGSFSFHVKKKHQLDMGVSKNRGTPKWMVYTFQTLLKWTIWGGFNPLVSEKHPYWRRSLGCLIWPFSLARSWAQPSQASPFFLDPKISTTTNESLMFFGVFL